MTVSETFAEWWVPGHPDLRVHGALTFDPAAGATVTLLNALPGVDVSTFRTPIAGVLVATLGRRRLPEERNACHGHCPDVGRV